MHHPVVDKIESLLIDHKFWYEKFVHEPVRTSEEAAKVRTGFGLNQGAKALIVKTKKTDAIEFVMIVVPGDKKFDSKKVKKYLLAKDISFATPQEVGEVTQGVQVGGVPPFGNLFGIKVLVDHTLLMLEKIIFNAGDRSVSIAMSTSDWTNLVKPEVGDFCQ